MAKMKASWMSSRISQRMRRRRNQYSSAIVRPCRGAEPCFPAREAGVADGTAGLHVAGDAGHLKPLAVTQQQFTALHAAEAATYAGLAADQQTTLAIDRIGSLVTQEPRMDDWATCHGVGAGASPTRVLDGPYGVTVTQAEVVASWSRSAASSARSAATGPQSGTRRRPHRSTSPIRPSSGNSAERN
jgi:hypothetical protein